jgi:hypothetical protein
LIDLPEPILDLKTGEGSEGEEVLIHRRELVPD